jgi:hypothetical protein
MKHIRKYFFVLVALLLIVEQAHASSCPSPNSVDIKSRLQTLAPSMDTDDGKIRGIPNRFCVFSKGSNVAFVDPMTISSRSPSIAATYLSTGLDLGALSLVPGVRTSGDVLCSALGASSIFLDIAGTFSGPRGPKSICVFADGSKIGPDELVKTTEYPSYLGLRRAVRSAPMKAELPYLLQTSPTTRSNVLNIFAYAGLPASALNFLFLANASPPNYSITSNQPWGGVQPTQVSANPNSYLKITVQAGRQGSTSPVNWFNATALPSPHLSASSSANPSTMNFAFTGTLVINDNQYAVVFGQYGVSGQNIWVIAGVGPGWTLDTSLSGPSLVTPDGIYGISPGSCGGGGNYGFQISQMSNPQGPC